MSLLSVNFMGLPLKNPIIAAAGPWCRDAAAMQKAIDAGAAAVVTETIALEKSHIVSPRIFYRQGEVYNTTLYSTMTLEDVEQEVERLQKGNAFLICNIRGTTPSELRYLASRMQRLGADALELCCFTPIGTKLEDWLREKGYSSLDELRGNALSSLTAFEDLPERLLRVKMAAPCDGSCPDGCRARCVGACLYDAISQGTEGITVDAAACSGCGLCVSLCPKKLFIMK